MVTGDAQLIGPVLALRERKSFVGADDLPFVKEQHAERVEPVDVRRSLGRCSRASEPRGGPVGCDPLPRRRFTNQLPTCRPTCRATLFSRPFWNRFIFAAYGAIPRTLYSALVIAAPIAREPVRKCDLGWLPM